MFILCNLSTNRCTPLRCKVRWRRRGTAGEESGHLAEEPWISVGQHEGSAVMYKSFKTGFKETCDKQITIFKVLRLLYVKWYVNIKKKKKYLHCVYGESMRWKENAKRCRHNRGHHYSGRRVVNSTRSGRYVGVRWSSFPPAPWTWGARKHEAYRW